MDRNEENRQQILEIVHNTSNFINLNQTFLRAIKNRRSTLIFAWAAKMPSSPANRPSNSKSVQSIQPLSASTKRNAHGSCCWLNGIVFCCRNNPMLLYSARSQWCFHISHLIKQKTRFYCAPCARTIIENVLRPAMQTAPEMRRSTDRPFNQPKIAYK